MNIRSALLLLPALLVTAGLFGGGLILALMQSLGYLPFIGQRELSLKAYKVLLSSREFWASLGLSLWIACAATLLAAALGTACALALRHVSRSSLLRLLFGLSLPIPHVVGALVTLLLFSQSGFFSRLAHSVHLTSNPADFPALVFDPRGIGVILELVWKETPFIGVSVLAALANLDPGLEDAARTLGANSWRRLSRVVLPQVWPTPGAAGILVFAFAFGSFEVPYLLGATSPTTLSVLAYRAFTDADLASRSAATAISVLVAALLGVLAWAYAKVTRVRI